MAIKPQSRPATDPDRRLPITPPSMCETSLLMFSDDAVIGGVVMHWPESEGEGGMTLAESKSVAPSKVKGPVRCHRCQLKCRDAEHYLSHKCEPRVPPDCLSLPSRWR